MRRLLRRFWCLGLRFGSEDVDEETLQAIPRKFGQRGITNEELSCVMINGSQVTGSNLFFTGKEAECITLVVGGGACKVRPEVGWLSLHAAASGALRQL